MSREPRFSILLPPGWVRAPVDDATDLKFGQLLEHVLAEAPVERRVALRTMLEKSIREMLASARSQNAVDLIMSLGAIQGLPVPASIMVSLLDLPSDVTGTPQEQLLKFANRSATAIELDGLVGVRRVKDNPGGPESAPHRTVSYIVHLPWSSEWLLFSASILTTDEPGYSEILVALESLVDAMMSTVRFTRSEVSK